MSETLPDETAARLRALEWVDDGHGEGFNCPPQCAESIATIKAALKSAPPPGEALTPEEWDIVDKLLYREGRLNIMFKLRRLRPVVDTETR